MGHLTILRFLVTERGADVNQVGKCAATPLYMAASSGNLDVMRLLVERAQGRPTSTRLALGKKDKPHYLLLPKCVA
jgi:ankyrin repeat protein